MIRPGDENNYLQKSGRLFQEWICSNWLAVEDNKLAFLRRNQKTLRADSYNAVRNADTNHIGTRVILPSSHTGSPRWFQDKFQGALAIMRKFGKPDFFITMTCNPCWDEIKQELPAGAIAQDRPDITSRVFKLKKDQLIQDLKAGNVLGKVASIIYTIEYQKRGLPHCHILLTLANESKILAS